MYAAMVREAGQEMFSCDGLGTLPTPAPTSNSPVFTLSPSPSPSSAVVVQTTLLFPLLVAALTLELNH